jgi:lipoate-protein ligase A
MTSFRHLSICHIVYNNSGVSMRQVRTLTTSFCAMKLAYEALGNLSHPGALKIDTWRLIASGALPGAMNMALDEALIESVIAGGPPVLRFYTWEPATLSLGVNQSLGEVDAEECARRGFGLVRRLTGGRAVLHQHELTYSVVARESDRRVSGGVVESYRKISEALVAGLRSLGADVALAAPDRRLHRALAQAMRNSDLGELAVDEGSHGAVCFDAASDYELTASGRKLVGSAQARRGGALLQHGSILLDVDWDAWVSVFRYRTEEGRKRAAQKLPTRMTSLKKELGRNVSAEEVVHALKQAFESVFEIGLDRGEPTEAENAAARRLAIEKYGNEVWTGRK